MDNQDLLAEMTADVVASYVSKNKVAISELPELIASVHGAFARLDSDNILPVETNQVPAVAIGNSVSEKYITCLEDGLEFKSLKRHLRSHHSMSPEQYRDKWGLPADYPMVAPNYSLKRSKLAKESGLGLASKT